MVGAEIRRYASDRRGQALNVFLGIAGGALGSLAETLLLPTIVLTFFVGQLTDSYVVVGLVPAVGVGCWLLARIPATIFVAPQRRKLPWAIGAALVRAASTALLAAVCFRATEGAEPQLLRSFFICYVAYSLASGFTGVPIAYVVAKAIPHDARPFFFRQRTVWSGVMGLVAGLVLVQLLGEAGPRFPRDYALLFLAATVCQTATAFFIATLREPIRISDSQRGSLNSVLGSLPQAIADANFRRFLSFRVLFAVASLSDPFLVIFAASELALPASYVGAYVMALVGGMLASSPLWLSVERRSGYRGVLQLSALIRLVAPLLALMLPFLARSDIYQENVTSDTVLPVLFSLAFVAIGVSLGGQSRASTTYLSEIAPGRRRESFGSITNGALAVSAMAPLLSGWIVERRDFPTLFIAAILIGLLAVFVSGALTDTHVRTRPNATAWRLRRAMPSTTGDRRRP